MSGQPKDHLKEKRIVTVNSFKAPRQWYEQVTKIAEESGWTVSMTIQRIFTMGLPTYHKFRKYERDEMGRQIRESKCRDDTNHALAVEHRKKA